MIDNNKNVELFLLKAYTVVFPVTFDFPCGRTPAH